MHIKGPFKQHAPGYLAEKVDRVDRYTEVLHTSRNIMLHRPCSIITPRDAEQKIELLLRGAYKSGAIYRFRGYTL